MEDKLYNIVLIYEFGHFILILNEKDILNIALIKLNNKTCLIWKFFYIEDR